MTRDEREAHVREIATFGLPPAGPVTTAGAPAPAVTTSAHTPTADGHILDLPYEAEPYTLANKRKVWIHPCSMEETRWLNLHAAGEVRALGLTNEADAAYAFNVHAQCWQVVCCLRTGPELGAPQALQPSDAAILRCNAGWRKDIEKIVKISDDLTGGQSEVDRLKEQLRGFFEDVAHSCKTLLSQPDTATLADLRPSLEACATSALQASSLLS